ncbi:MAG: alpha/beta hydrolase [Elusimicrobiota bacterium]|nr:alpha/beta hydrolase [Elusimicrobiota bacterium]
MPSFTISRALPFLALALAGCSGCSGVFLQPDRALHAKPEQVGAAWEEARFASADGTALTGLWLPARPGPGKGVVVQFHGNGENMTSHFLFVWWLTLEGWDVLAFDYRGYGASGGEKSLAGAVEDGAAALRWARVKAAGRPLVVVGQSLGGALALASLEKDGGEGVKGLILDSTFASYRAIAREKLGLLWLTWPFQYPLSFLVGDGLAAERFARRRKPVPLLTFHGQADPIVPLHHGRRLFEAALGPKEFVVVAGDGHTEAFGARRPEHKARILAFLADAAR